jgi:hypothetical protein
MNDNGLQITTHEALYPQKSGDDVDAKGFTKRELQVRQRKEV